MEIPPLCCHAALLLNAASDWMMLTSLSLDLTLPENKTKQKKTRGEARTLG